MKCAEGHETGSDQFVLLSSVYSHSVLNEVKSMQRGKQGQSTQPHPFEFAGIS